MASALIGLLDPDGRHRLSYCEFDALNGFATAKPVEQHMDCICQKMGGLGRRAAPLGLR